MTDKLPLVERKMDFFKEVIQKTLLHVQANKTLDILGIMDVATCVEKLGELSKMVDQVGALCGKKQADALVSALQLINNELSSLLKNYGTQDLDHLLLVCFGNHHPLAANPEEEAKLQLLKKYFHPTGYKVVSLKEGDECENMVHLDCFDVASLYKQFHLKVHGLKVFIRSVPMKKVLMVTGVLDNVMVDFLSPLFVHARLASIFANAPKDGEFASDSFKKFVEALTLKDLLVCNSNQDVYSKFAGIVSHCHSIKQKAIAQAVKDFANSDLYTKRMMLMALLIRSSHYENQYLAYLLYDLLSNDANGNVDTKDQTTLFDSFPWSVRQLFKHAMKKTIQYTNDLSNFDLNKIPLEQQICLLKVPDTVKEKAMIKLKEVKAKSEDSGSKARQYLEGLLRIPFGVYKREPVLHIMDHVRAQFKDMCTRHSLSPLVPPKDNYTSIETLKYIKLLENNVHSEVIPREALRAHLMHGDKATLVKHNKVLDGVLKQAGWSRPKAAQNKEGLATRAGELFDAHIANDPALVAQVAKECGMEATKTVDGGLASDVMRIQAQLKEVGDYMSNVRAVLDDAVYGHEKAKRQIERIIAQWINGDQQGYCFGFEGAAGIGKTSLAKRGISHCLKDAEGKSRPFAMIQMGGDSNGSTLHGHNYTYVGSTWGSIVQILMDKKCMNPIIFIDEVDKISRTEHGREIVGILTHLLDPAQNDCFQDKYFNGVELDLSKALFILSYNDPEAIDKILLDRVHRIKFNTLTVKDKLVICNGHLLPDIYAKMGLEGMIHFDDHVLSHIIREYTCEAGVRKLKEILFEIVGEINLEILKNVDHDYELPISISIADVQTKYFKDRRVAKVYQVHTQSKVGVINALWANQLSQGGVLPLQASFVPSDKFLSLTLTGSMGEVMKESIHVSLTNAWNLTSPERQKYLVETYNNVQQNQVCGIHVHCPDISTKKDGPSATTAFTVLLYSLLNDVKIKPHFGITGETHFGGHLTEIGGLQEKIIHSIRSGVSEFIFPKENERDFERIMEKYADDPLLEGVQFHCVDHVDRVLELILDLDNENRDN